MYLLWKTCKTDGILGKILLKYNWGRSRKSPSPIEKDLSLFKERRQECLVNQGRKSISDIYHVTNRGVNHLSIFAQNREKGRMLNLIRENCDKYHVGIYSYCIMPNHFHLLIKASLSDLSAFMAVISSKYASYYNYKHKRSGVVFQNRFQSQCIEDANYFWNCLRYIHLNPVKAKLCKDPRSYKYGSMNELCKIRKKEILDENVYKKIKEFFGTAEQFWHFIICRIVVTSYYLLI